MGDTFGFFGTAEDLAQLRSAQFETFFEAFGKAQQPCLVNDLDGTHAPFEQDPAAVKLYAGLPSRIDELQNLGVRVVWATGRTVESAMPILQSLQHPQEIWGCHGWERYVPGNQVVKVPVPAPARKALNRLARWEKVVKYYEGWCEKKYASFTIHWRGVPSEDVLEIKRFIHRRWHAGKFDTHLDLCHCEAGVELRAPGCDKGNVVRMAARENAVIAFLGDDFTDEDGFRALRHIREYDPKFQGLGILVRDESRETLADHWITPPNKLLKFYDRLIDARRQARPKEVVSAAPFLKVVS